MAKISDKNFKGTTTTGFNYEVNPRIKQDWRVVRAITDIQSKDANVQIKSAGMLVSLVLGDAENDLMEHIAGYSEGFVPAKAVYAEISEIIKAIPNSKN